MSLPQTLPPQPLISVVVCTRDRAWSLHRMLDSAEGLSLPDGLVWEMIVVDNGSRDDTADVVAFHAKTLPIRYQYEPQAGLSFARNRGVAAASGQYLVWTDDDVTLEPEWLQAYIEAFARHSEAAVFGGSVLPILEAPTPEWVTINRFELRYLFAERLLDSVPTRVSDGVGDLPVGANFAVRAVEQRAFLYDTHLGASPKFNRLGEEEQVIRSILSAGAVGWWVPGANVNHHIPSARQTLKYVEKYSLAGGETWAYWYLEGRGDTSRPGAVRALNAPAWIWKRYVLDYLRFRLFKLLDRPDQWLRALSSYCFFRGTLSYLYRG